MKVLAINDIDYIQMSKIVYFIEAFCETLNIIKTMTYWIHTHINPIYEIRKQKRKRNIHIEIMHKNMTTATKTFSTDRNSNFCLDDKN